MSNSRLALAPNIAFFSFLNKLIYKLTTFIVSNLLAFREGVKKLHFADLPAAQPPPPPSHPLARTFDEPVGAFLRSSRLFSGFTPCKKNSHISPRFADRPVPVEECGHEGRVDGGEGQQEPGDQGQ